MKLKNVKRILVADGSIDMSQYTDMAQSSSYYCRLVNRRNGVLLTATSWESPCREDFMFVGHVLCDAEVANSTQELPSCPSDLRYQVHDDGEWLTVYWRPGSNGGLNQTFTIKIDRNGADGLLQTPVYQISVEQNIWYGEMSHNTTVISLEYQRLYTVTVEAKNSLGQAANCSKIRVNVDKEVSTNLPSTTSLTSELTSKTCRDSEAVSVLSVFLGASFTSVIILAVLYTRSLGHCTSCRICLLGTKTGGIFVWSRSKTLSLETENTKSNKDIADHREKRGQGERNAADDKEKDIYENCELERTYDEVVDISCDGDKHNYMAAVDLLVKTVTFGSPTTLKLSRLTPRQTVTTDSKTNCHD
ncbi:hypothetical protein Btru_006941 [Bulinus truncatus]|nr:hypothetical protein Btru_006941 [Bulinus truncatus]